MRLHLQHLTALSLTSFIIFTASMAERLSRVQEVASSNPNGQPNLTQRCKRFTTASTSLQVAVLPWRYDAEMGIANSLHVKEIRRVYSERFGFWIIYLKL